MRNLLRPVAVLATGVIFTTTLATAPAQAAPADDGGQWLTTQLTDGLIVGEYHDTWTDPENPAWVEYNDYGLTTDVGLAIADLGGQDAALGEVRDALAENVENYTGAGGEVYAGSTAKLLVLAQESGSDARDFGGFDLVKRLSRATIGKGAARGRIQDQSDFGDFSNTLGQAFAARGLTDAGSRKATKAVRFLLLQQCDAGYFRLTFSPVGARKQGCDQARPRNRAADTDATALAVLNLAGLPRAAKTRAVRSAINDAGRWMRRTQKKNGSFGGGVSTEGSNTNSTGLAAWALGDTGSCRPARKAARWVRDLQVGDATGTPLEGDEGAIAYDRAGYTAGEDDGITVETEDQWRRATAQAAPGLAFTGGC